MGVDLGAATGIDAREGCRETSAADCRGFLLMELLPLLLDG